MAQDDVQERSEEATPKRLLDARDRGQVPRSRELNTFLLLIVGGGGLMYLGPDVVRGTLGIMERAFQPHHATRADPEVVLEVFANTVQDALLLLVPLFSVLVITAILAPLALGGWTLSAQALEFKWERIDPIKGLGRVFSARGLVELLKALAKFAFLGSVVGLWLWSEVPAFMTLGIASFASGVSSTAEIVIFSFLVAALPMLLVAAIDVPFQLWDHARQLRMSRKEVKDEMKETEGSPEVRARIRRQQQEIAQRRMMAEVPEADVIISNPTHFSVALKYERDAPGAPVMIAKGVDMVALRIREIGAAHAVPLVEAPLLARALFYNGELEKEIPAPLFMAVAQVLAYVYRLQAGEVFERAPFESDELPVPPGMRTE